MTLGIDVDGVLAKFEEAFAKLFPGRQFPIDDPSFPAVWHWPQHYGAEPEEVTRAWDHVRASRSFWFTLPPLDGGQWRNLHSLELLESMGDRVYFITQRVGHYAKQQTEQWLQWHGFLAPTVLVVTGDKAPVVEALGCDVFIDDKPKNLEGLGESTRAYLRDAPHNRDATFQRPVIRVWSLWEMLYREGVVNAYGDPAAFG